MTRHLDLLIYLLTWATLLPALALIVVRWGTWRTIEGRGLAIFGACLTLATGWLLVGELADQMGYGGLAARPWRPLLFRGLLAVGLWALLWWDWRRR